MLSRAYMRSIGISLPNGCIKSRLFSSNNKDIPSLLTNISKPGSTIVPHDEYFHRAGAWDDKDLGSLLNANKNWANRVTKEKPGFFEELKKGHAPKILWIGCSDARVPANEIIGEPPGSVFVHRNVANLVVNTDFNCMSVIQYAVEVLKVKHIIVCGHYDCGGIRAATEMKDHKSPLENWLRNIRDIYRIHKDELNTIDDLVQRRRRLVELNVIEQCLNIFKTSAVQRRRIESYLEMTSKDNPNEHINFSEPRVHAFVYEPGTGVLNKLAIDFDDYIKDLRGVYDLYKIDKEVHPELYKQSFKDHLIEEKAFEVVDAILATSETLGKIGKSKDQNSTVTKTN